MASFRTIRKILLFWGILLLGCSGMEQSEREKVRRLNCHGEPIYRLEKEVAYSISAPIRVSRDSYPWESESNLPKITKDFFRCRGNPTNPQVLDARDITKTIADCPGCSRHGLPIIHGKEGVYPILVELLNFVQKKTGKRVIITCGHRCPQHNTYADSSKENLVSKHQVGAEVDFYVQGMEDRPQEIAGILMQYFQESPAYRKDRENREFRRLQTNDIEVQPWYNQEVLIKLYKADEGRDIDNRHPHPYLSVQVRFDRQTREKVIYTWSKAHQGYPRS